MSDVKEAPDAEAAGDEAAVAAKRKKKLLMIGAAAAVVLLGGGGGAAFFLMGGDDAAAEEGAADHGAAAGKGGDHGGGGQGEAFLDVPPLVVNLRSADGGARFLKIHFMLVPGPKGSVETLKPQLPLLLDAYQPFLRELRPEDLAGSAAVFRIKEEMLIRSHDALGDSMVKDVLIQDLIQQ